MKKTLFILFTAMLLVSCDPVHYIDFRNFTQEEAVVTIRLKPDADKEIYRSSKDEYPIEGDSIVLHIPKKESKSLFFGMGTWGDEGASVAGTIKTLEIETSEIKTVYKTEKVIEDVFKDNLKGIWFKSEIRIDIE